MRTGLATVIGMTSLPALLLGQADLEELKRRENRSALEIAESLSKHYGHEMKQISYIPALALWGRLWLAELQETDGVRDDVLRIARAAPQPKKMTGPVVAGHLIFAALGDRERVVEAAAVGLSETGEPLPQVNNSNGMSDSVFMDCPLLTAAGRLTEEDRYFTAAANHLFAMEVMCLREDRLYNHSRKCEAAWGRGNGFPALGVALMLTEFPDTHTDFEDVVTSFREHMDGLSKHQGKDGMWHQVIDHPESYPEFSCTCMIGFAMSRGIRLGYLEPEIYQPLADRAWTAIKRRIHLDGEFLEGVCTGTGAQATLEDYFARKAIFGRDERGGAMALMFAVERLAQELDADE